MESANNLNVHQICSIRSYIKSECKYYDFKKAKTVLFFWKTEEGFYYNFTLGSPYLKTKEQIEEDGMLYCEGEKVYYKPHLEICMSNKYVFTKYFNRIEELNQFAELLKGENVNWIDCKIY